MENLPIILSLLEYGVSLFEKVIAAAPSKRQLDAELHARLMRLVDRMAALPKRFAEYDAALAARDLPKP